MRLVKEVIAAVDSKVNEHEKRRRLKDFHARMESKSIMLMKSGQMFAKEDLLRRRLIHDGVLHLKSSQGRLKGAEPFPLFLSRHMVASPPAGSSSKHKCFISGSSPEVHALLLSDVFVFLQEKDQKYIFALLVGPLFCLCLLSLLSLIPPSVELACAALSFSSV